MPISARIAVVCLLLAAPIVGHAVATQPESSAFTVAVLRRDGVIIPFGIFDGKGWKSSWPLEVTAKELPANLASIPRGWWGKPGPLSQLTAWVNGVSRGPIHVHLGSLKLLRLMCSARAGLVTDYKPTEPSPPPLVQPFPKDGLAVSGAQRVDPIEIVPPDAPEWAETAREMTADFDQAEQRAARTFLDWHHPFNEVQRRRFIPRLEALYRAPMDEQGWTAYYLEAARLYPPSPDDRGCGLVASAGGWMARGPNGKRSFRLYARITYCDRQGMLYMLPLGLIKARDRSYWVYQMSGYGREGYLIGRPRPKETITELQYAGGTCPF
jgi:hypothetical protein